MGMGKSRNWGKLAATRTALGNLTNAAGGKYADDDKTKSTGDARAKGGAARDNWRMAKLKTAAVAALGSKKPPTKTNGELAFLENRVERTLQKAERMTGTTPPPQENKGVPYVRKPLWAPVVRGEGREAPREPGYKARRQKPAWKPGGALNQAGGVGHHDDKGSFAFGHRAPFAYRGD